MSDIKNDTFEGNKTALQEQYTLTREQLSDGYNILTNHHLKEVYDKHNIWFSETDFTKHKHKSLSSIDKYGYALKGIGSYVPYLGITYMSLTSHQLVGKQLSILGLCTVVFIAW